MSSLIEILPLIIGTATTDYQIDLLYMFSCAIGVICVMFFLKLFLLIGGLTSKR